MRDNSIKFQLDHISKYEPFQKKQKSAIGYSQEVKPIESNSFILKDTSQNIPCTSETTSFEEFILGFKVVNEDSSSKKKNTLNKGNGQKIDPTGDDGEEEIKELSFDSSEKGEGKKRKKKFLNTGCCAVIRRRNTEENIEYWQD